MNLLYRVAPVILMDLDPIFFFVLFIHVYIYLVAYAIAWQARCWGGTPGLVFASKTMAW